MAVILHEFTVRMAILRRPVKERPLCPLEAVKDWCGCTWHEDELWPRRSRVVRHGDNPEQSREFTDEALLDSEECARGHVLTMCEWAASVVSYTHAPDEPARGTEGDRSRVRGPRGGGSQ